MAATVAAVEVVIEVVTEAVTEALTWIVTEVVTGQNGRLGAARLYRSSGTAGLESEYHWVRRLAQLVGLSLAILSLASP